MELFQFLIQNSLTDLIIEIIANTTGVSDKVAFLHLYKDRYPSSNGRIETEKIISTEIVNYGSEHGHMFQKTEKIVIRNEKILIKYGKNTREVDYLENLPIQDFSRANDAIKLRQKE